MITESVHVTQCLILYHAPAQKNELTIVFVVYILFYFQQEISLRYIIINSLMQYIIYNGIVISKNHQNFQLYQSNTTLRLCNKYSRCMHVFHFISFH